MTSEPSRQKPGRNDPCWCGSGKKFKFCHLQREREPTPGVEDVKRAILGPLNRKTCLHPDGGPTLCHGGIVKAHTIPRAGSLTRIARKGHVYGLRSKEHDPTFQLKPKLIGLRNASTFTGFCGEHDRTVFAPIETKPFAPSAEQAFLLGYRALCRELYGKRARQQSIQNQKALDKGRSPTEQRAIQAFLQKDEAANNLGLRDAEHHKQIYDRILQSSDFSDVRYFIIEFGVVPDVMCSAAHYPQFDFRGNTLQDFQSKAVLDMVAFSIVATEGGGAAVFTWIGDSEPVTRLVDSLDALPDGEIDDALVRYAFEFFDNLYFSPDWWDNVDDRSQVMLVKRQTEAAMLTVRRRPNCLTDDGVRTVTWPVTARHKNW